MQYDKTIQELIKNNMYNKNQEVYIIASIEGKGNHIGRIKNISLDVNDDVIIEVDIDEKSVTEHVR